MNQFLAFIFALIVSLPAHANLEIPANWNQLRLAADIEGEKVVLSLAVEQHTLTSLTINFRGQDMQVTQSEMAGLPTHLALNTVRVTAPSPKFPMGPALRISIDSLPRGHGHPPAATVQFLFSGHSYLGWSVDFMKEDKVLRSERKTPGQPVRPQK
jgi:hypothetical protein